MKILIPILLILALALARGGCGDFAPDPTETPGTTVEYSFDRSNFPTIAGGEAQRPLAEAIAAIMLGETRESAADMLSFGSTGEAWAALESGEAGLVLHACREERRHPATGEPLSLQTEWPERLGKNWEPAA